MLKCEQRPVRTSSTDGFISQQYWSCFVALLRDRIFIQNLSLSLVLDDLVSVFFGCIQITRRESTAEKKTTIFPNIHPIQWSANSYEFFSTTIFTSFSSQGDSDGKTIIGNLLFVGCNIFKEGKPSAIMEMQDQ